MSMTTHISINVLPVAGNEKGIKRSFLNFAKKRKLPFKIHTNWKALADTGSRESLKDWGITKIEASSTFRNSSMIFGLDFVEHMDSLNSFLTDAVVRVTVNAEADAYANVTDTYVYKDGQEVYSVRSREEQIYSELEYDPAGYEDGKSPKEQEQEASDNLPF